VRQIGLDYMAVADDDVTGPMAAVKDQYGKRHEIRVDIRRGKGPLPRPGEIWIVDRTLGVWTFAACVSPSLPRIDGPASGTLSALLSALDEAGLIEWGASNYSLAANEDYADGVSLSGEGLGSGTGSFSIASANIKFSLSKEESLQDLGTVIENGADIIGIQEMRHDILGDIPGYGNHVPSGESRALPIIWRESMFGLLDKGSIQVITPDNRSTGWGWISWVKLTHLPTGKIVIVGNNHSCPTVENRGRYRLDAQGQHRVQMHQQHMAGMRDFVNDRTAEGLVFQIGDLNFNFRTDSVVRHPDGPYVKMNSAGMSASYRVIMPEGGTHRGGGRLIDYVMFERAKPLEVRSQRIIRGLNTDHHAVLVAFDLTDVPEPA
jgi:hypothetical protein